jgi:hypothetical protein
VWSILRDGSAIVYVPKDQIEMAFLHRIRTAIDGAGTIITVIGWLGISAWVVGLASTVGGVGWAMISGIPGPFVLMAAFCTFTGAVYLALVPMVYRALLRVQASPARTRPDPEIWRHLSTLQLYEAACLLADIDPDFQTADNPGDANGWCRALGEAIKAEEISRIPSPRDNRDHLLPDGYHPHRETVITRDALKKFAAKRQVRRAFLNDT